MEVTPPFVVFADKRWRRLRQRRRIILPSQVYVLCIILEMAKTVLSAVKWEVRVNEKSDTSEVGTNFRKSLN